MSLVHSAFILWEGIHQPRRASARLVACSNDVDCLRQYEGHSKKREDRSTHASRDEMQSCET